MILLEVVVGAIVRMGVEVVTAVMAMAFHRWDLCLCVNPCMYIYIPESNFPF